MTLHPVFVLVFVCNFSLLVSSFVLSIFQPVSLHWDSVDEKLLVVETKYSRSTEGIFSQFSFLGFCGI